MNKLHKETSPYLLEHKLNPVDWHAWNNETLNKAKKENKPILLSIGYSACHWCHVMANESFEDNKIAKIMNKNFINIKVDREERPDLDAIYQNALSVQGEHGGWPLTMFLTPDCEPFWGGTYFPPISKFGRPAFPDVLKFIFNLFHEEKNKIKKNVLLIKTALINTSKNIKENKINDQLSEQVSLSLINIMDKKFGGIQGAPKFPNVPIFENILRYFCNKGINNKINHQLIITTLDKMCCGGIYDHVGGGFARYSTDEKWLVPHFEKMLYDNAQIIELLILGYQQYKEDELYKNKIFETIEWVLRKMKTKENGLASAIDADSEGVEGKFYVWTKKEIEEVLQNKSKEFCKTFDVTNKGNWENKNILNLIQKPNKSELKKNKVLLQKLFIVRKKRVPPRLDGKILTDCNGLMINALAKAGWVFNKREWLNWAEKIYDFIIKNLFFNKELYHSWKSSKVKTFATLDDYAALLRCSITLYETTNQKKYLDNAENFSKKIIKNYKDKKDGGFFTTSDKTKDIIVKLKSTYDTAVPSGIGLISQSFAKLYYLTGKNNYFKEASASLKSVSGNIKKNFFSTVSLIKANQLLQDGVQIIFIKGKKNQKYLLDQIKKMYIPNKIFQQINNSNKLKKKHPAYGKKTFNGKTTIYICKNQTCSQPITTIKELKKNLI